MAAEDLQDRRRGAYQAAGVDLGAADEALGRIGAVVASTYTPGVVRGLGAFGGLFALPTGLREPTLVASTDGVGTKTVIAAATGRLRQVGRDLVNHCVNDILVQGAEPLFFLDYVASSRLDPAVVVEVVTGVAEACREAGMALLGGETAEMPGVYVAGQLWRATSCSLSSPAVCRRTASAWRGNWCWRPTAGWTPRSRATLRGAPSAPP